MSAHASKKEDVQGYVLVYELWRFALGLQASDVLPAPLPLSEVCPAKVE
jgi:hypothetical protein